MLAQHEAMIRIDNQHGVFPQVILVHHIQHLSQIRITHGHKRPVLIDTVLHLFRCLHHLMVSRPVKHHALVSVFIRLFVAFRCKIRFMGIVILQLKVPVVGSVIISDKIKPVGEILGNRLIGLILHVITVDVLLPSAEILSSAQVLRNLPFHSALPGVPLLSSDKLVGIVLIYIVSAALFPVMPVIRSQMGINSVCL